MLLAALDAAWVRGIALFDVLWDDPVGGGVTCGMMLRGLSRTAHSLPTATSTHPPTLDNPPAPHSKPLTPGHEPQLSQDVHHMPLHPRDACSRVPRHMQLPTCHMHNPEPPPADLPAYPPTHINTTRSPTHPCTHTLLPAHPANPQPPPPAHTPTKLFTHLNMSPSSPRTCITCRCGHGMPAPVYPATCNSPLLAKWAASAAMPPLAPLTAPSSATELENVQ